MTDTIRITLPDGGAWSASGLGYEVEEWAAASHIAGGAPHCALINLIEPVLMTHDGDFPRTIGDGEWVLEGWGGENGDTLIYHRYHSARKPAA